MLRNVAMHIAARFYEVRSDAAWRRYLDSRDPALRDRAFALLKRATDIRERIAR